jgi:lipid-binding SYLF domain-containing protein
LLLKTVQYGYNQATTEEIIMFKSRISLAIALTVAVLAIPVQPARAFPGPHLFHRAAPVAVPLSVEAETTLHQLYASSPKAAALGHEAKAILVFPRVAKAGFMAGFSHGEGVLLKEGHVAGYYGTTGVSWGPQAGAQRYGYAVFLMTDEAVAYLKRLRGWEIGAGPSIVVLDKGHAGKISTTTLNSDAYAVIFNQHGLMAGLGIEGSKIALLDR